MFQLRHIYLKIVFSMVIFILFILLLEFTFRITHLFGAKISWTKPDPILGYSFKSGQEYWANDENNHPITGKINRYGWRDKEWELNKNINTYRIAVLGDSFVEALQVESEFTFLSLAEQQLKKKLNKNIEFMNFGRSGYTQTEEYIILKNQVINFLPDMVIVLFFPGNDISDISKNTSTNVMRPFYNISKDGKLILDTSFIDTKEYKIKEMVNIFKNHSAIISFFAEKYNFWKINRANRFVNTKRSYNDNRIYGYLSLMTQHPDEEYRINYKLNKMLIQEMVNICRDHNIKFMLVCCDIYIENNEVAYLTNIDNSFNQEYFETDLSEFAKSINIDYVGLQQVFMKGNRNWAMEYHWSHWNYAGHKLVADTLVSKLISIIRFSN